jgi:hypothetical protein
MGFVARNLSRPDPDSNLEKRPQLGHRVLPDAMDVLEVFHRLEAAVLLPPGHDLIDVPVADSQGGAQLLARGCV